MIAVECRKCHQELTEPGALIFTPPVGLAVWVGKYHLCVACYLAVSKFIDE